MSRILVFLILCFRFQKIGLCVSYNTAQSKHLELGKDFDEKVLRWNDINLKEEEEFQNEITEHLLSLPSLPMCIEGLMLLMLINIFIEW